MSVDISLLTLFVREIDDMPGSEVLYTAVIAASLPIATTIDVHVDLSFYNMKDEL